MKKNYTKPELEVVSYNVENVITVDVSTMFTTDGSNGTTAKEQVKSVNYTEIFKGV